ncbi:aminotransferase [Fibrobacterales bacterium]|nr:aminotransferase [Fibrobacterales bacterium]
MSLETSERVSKFTESVIRKMSVVAAKYGAINLSQGYPDNDPPKEILEALKKAAIAGPHQYAMTWGAKNFRDALAKKVSHFSGLEIDPDKNIVVTCGGTEAMMSAMMTALNPGDKVIVFSPFYENYGADAILSGAEPIFVPLHPPTFRFVKSELRHAFEQGARALVLCNPNNPTGRVFNLKELQIIANLAEEFDAFVITDEVYEHIVYEPHKHIYFASLPRMRERTIWCSSLSKTYSITGWRLGYVIAPERVINGAKKVHDFLTVGAAAPLQEAAVVGLNFNDDYYAELRDKYAHQRKIFLNELVEAKLKFYEPEGAYFVLVNIDEFLKDGGGRFNDDTEFCEWLAEKVGVAAVPGSSFFRENVKNFIRLHFAKSEETLRESGHRLRKIREVL